MAQNYLIDLLQGASNSAASNVSAPVDGLAWLLRKAGMPIQNPVGGSDWMAQRGLTVEPKNKIAGLLGESVGGVLPIVAAAKAPQIANGLLWMMENAATPSTLNRQAGMIRIPGRGQIPETRGDVNKLADRLTGLLDDAGVKYQADKSRLSPARYFEMDNPSTPAADIAQYGHEPLKVRISDHVNVHGADLSVDPHTGTTFEEMLQSLRDKGIPVAARVKPASKAVVPDETLERIFGKPIAEIPQSWIDSQRRNLVWDKKGYWTERR